MQQNPAAGEPLAGKPPARDPYRFVFWLLLLLFEAFLFTVPVFPSSDGPLHIYLSSILLKLATHSSPLYEHYYAIRHLIQPYSFHYYLLLGLEHWMTADHAEKVFVGLIWFTQAVGFRTLARTLGPGAPAVSLWVFPLLFSWPIGGGFFNYVFAIGLMFFGLALYYRLREPAHRGRNLALLGLTLILLVLAHPVPLMLLIFLVGMDLLVRLVLSWRSSERPGFSRWEFAAFGLACVAFVFPMLIADKADVAQSIRSDIRLHTEYFRNILSGRRLGLFYNLGIVGWTYEALLELMLPVSVVLLLASGVARRAREGLLTASDRLLGSVLLFLLLTLFSPENMNGSSLFTVRMWFMVWLLGSCAAAGFLRKGWASRTIAGVGVALSFLCLFYAWIYIRPLAAQQVAIEHAPLPYHATGLFIQPYDGMDSSTENTSYAEQFWEAGRAFANHDDVLLNTPWLQLTIIPLRENGHSGLMRDYSPNQASENPNTLPAYLLSHPNAKEEALAHAQFLLFADPNGRPPAPLKLAGTVLGADSPAWACRQQQFFAVCTKILPQER